MDNDKKVYFTFLYFNKCNIQELFLSGNRLCLSKLLSVVDLEEIISDAMFYCPLEAMEYTIKL